MKSRTTSWAVGALLSGLALLAGCGSSAHGAQATPTIAAPEHVTLITAKASFGSYLTDSSGRALYMWDADRGGTPTCYDDCAAEWPPVTVSGDVTAGPGVQKSLISEVKRTDGAEQVTYGGWPLYFYRPDVHPGDLSGQGNTGFGAVWWVVAPDGTPLPSEPQS